MGLYGLNTPMPYGKHKMVKIKDLPLVYLENVKTHGTLDPKLHDFIKENFDLIKEIQSKPKDEIQFCGKVVFPSEEAAKRKMKEIANINEGNGMRYGHVRTAPVRVYFCSKCGGYHLTSKPQTNDTGRTAKRIF